MSATTQPVRCRCAGVVAGDDELVVAGGMVSVVVSTLAMTIGAMQRERQSTAEDSVEIAFQALVSDEPPGRFPTIAALAGDRPIVWLAFALGLSN